MWIQIRAARQAAQSALAAAQRRRALAEAAAFGEKEDKDKRPRPSTTASTKVTPEAKVPRSTSTADYMEPKRLSFSEADGSPGAKPTKYISFGICYWEIIHWLGQLNFGSVWPPAIPCRRQFARCWCHVSLDSCFYEGNLLWQVFLATSMYA